MSGGHFECYGMSDLDGEWRDEELNELYFDLFGSSTYHSRPFGKLYYDREPRRCEFGPRGGGLFESLDFYLSGDITEDEYHEEVMRFKDKWFRKTPRNRIKFYQDKFREYAEEIVQQFELELGRYEEASE